jgi:hypothetical protein
MKGSKETKAPLDPTFPLPYPPLLFSAIWREGGKEKKIQSSSHALFN